MIELLETNKIDGLAQYTADNLEVFLTREGDRYLMIELIQKLKNKKIIVISTMDEVFD